MGSQDYLNGDAIYLRQSTVAHIGTNLTKFIRLDFPTLKQSHNIRRSMEILLYGYVLPKGWLYI